MHQIAHSIVSSHNPKTMASYINFFPFMEINYEIDNNVILAILDSFEHWHHFLEGSPHQINFVVWSQ
mgnify:FL=1